MVNQLLLQISTSCGIIDVVKNQAQDSRYRLTAATCRKSRQTAAMKEKSKKAKAKEKRFPPYTPFLKRKRKRKERKKKGTCCFAFIERL